MENSPKRRKYRDNPYNINYNESNNTYIVVFNFNSNRYCFLSASNGLSNMFSKIW